MFKGHRMQVILPFVVLLGLSLGPSAAVRAQSKEDSGKGLIWYESVIGSSSSLGTVTRFDSTLGYNFNHHFAVDFGGVLEYYPSRRTMLRFDLGHAAVFYGSARVIAPAGPPFYGGFLNPGFRDNGMQFTTGFGWRF